MSSNVPSLPATPIHKAEVMTFQPFSDSAALDEFSASLQMSDEDRRHDAWIPSDETKNILINMATSPPGTYIPSIDQLCLPSLVVTDSQVYTKITHLSHYNKDCHVLAPKSFSMEFYKGIIGK